MSNVWVITKGDYDDYEIVAACSTKEKAEEMCALLNANPWNGEHSVSEFPLDVIPAHQERVLGYRAEYTYLTEDAGSMVVKESYYDPYYESKSEFYEGNMVAFAATRERCVDILLAAVEEKKRIDAIKKSQNRG